VYTIGAYFERKKHDRKISIKDEYGNKKDSGSPKMSVMRTGSVRIKKCEQPVK